MISKEKQKFIKSLHTKKNRQKEGLFLVEGGKSLEELLLSHFEIQYLYITEKFLKKYPSLLEKRTYFLSEQSDIEKISTLSVNDMGIAVVKQREYSQKDIDYNSYSLVLDTINDPGNMGTILRVADWYGIKQIICNTNTVELYNPKVIMASMGSFSRITFIQMDIVEYLSQTNMTNYGAFLEGENIHTTKFHSQGNIVIGNESHGISPEVEKYIDYKITIPQFGKAESLNAGVATAIILDNLFRSL